MVDFDGMKIALFFGYVACIGRMVMNETSIRQAQNVGVFFFLFFHFNIFTMKNELDLHFVIRIFSRPNIPWNRKNLIKLALNDRWLS